jgi:hypothetical protein
MLAVLVVAVAVRAQTTKPECACCMTLGFGGTCDQASCCCPKQIGSGGSACTAPPPSPPASTKSECTCCMALGFGGTCDQASCCCPKQIGSGGSACSTAGISGPAPSPASAVCPLMRHPCNLNSSVWSKINCSNNAACQGCTKQKGPDDKTIQGPRCVYRNPANGNSGSQLGGSSVTPQPGGLSICDVSLYGVGECHAGKKGKPVKISCAAVASNTGGILSLSGGHGVACCEDTKDPGYKPGCRNDPGKTPNVILGVVQANADAVPTSCKPGCNPGYKLMPGTSVTRCQNGMLRPATCAPLGCPLSQVTKAPITRSTTGWGVGNCTRALLTGESCQPTCSGRYLVSGRSTCAAGVMSYARCELKCRLPPPPLNGSVGGCVVPMDPGQTCQPRCDGGFELIPPGGASCSGADDLINGAAFLREAKCASRGCDVSALPSGGRPGGTCCTLAGCKIGHGETCRPMCRFGYSVSGNTSCTNGKATFAKCNPDPCTVSPPSDGGFGDCPAVLKVGASCTPSCKPGYQLVAGVRVEAKHFCTLGVLQEAVCQPRGCDASTPPDNGVAGDCPKLLQHGDTCRPACTSPYHLRTILCVSIRSLDWLRFTYVHDNESTNLCHVGTSSTA